MSKLIELLGAPSANIVIGKRGSGKTAFLMSVLEAAHNRGLKCYLLGLPKSKWSLLPDYITPVRNFDSIPDNAAVACDESYIFIYAREHAKYFNRFVAKLLGTTRQKNWVLVFATHQCRKIDVGVVMDVDNIIIRQPSWLHVKYERQEIRRLIEQAAKFFNKCKEPVKHAYIYTEKGPVVVKLSLPSFWSSELSNAFSGLSLDEM